MSGRGENRTVMGNLLGAHASDEVLEQYSMGTLPESQAGPLEEHLLVCPECQDRLEQTDALLAAARAAARKLRADPPSKRRIPMPVWAAALVAMLALVVLTGRPWRFLNSTNGPPVTVLLQSSRGPEGRVGSSAPSGKPLILTVDLTELPAMDSYRLEIVNPRGSRVWQSTMAAKDRKITAPVSARLSRGGYWVRLYTPPGELLREFALKIE